MRDIKYLRRGVITSLITVFFLLAGNVCANQSATAEAPVELSAESIVVKAACELICQGKFDAAGELIEQSKQSTQGKAQSLSELPKIVQSYRDIEQQRQSSREAEYAKQLSELEKFREVSKAVKTGGEELIRSDINDVNDANNVIKMLAVIAQANEFADDAQRTKLLSDSFVKQTIAKAMTKAAALESKGKWLEAYLMCYRWLPAIDKDNQSYSDHADELVDKANIVSSFQDSPCETSKERYEGIEKQMFIRAIDALHYSYVGVILYREMADKAIKRCQLLAEVMTTSFSEISKSKGVSEGSFLPPDSKQLSAWSAGLSAIMDEVNQSPIGMSKDKFIEIFENLLDLNTATVQLPKQVLIAQFSEAAFSALDPYTVIIWPKQKADFEKEMTGEFAGIGILLSKEKGFLMVASLLPDTPAYNSGLDAGDVIAAADGVDTKDMSLTCAVKKISGPAGTKVTLTIKRPGEEKSRDITITRARIIVPPVRGWKRTEAGKWQYMVDDKDKIGYVHMTSFDQRTTEDFEKVLDQLEAEGLKGLILDLRNNSGGLLNVAVEVVDKFIREGLIVRTQPRFGTPTYAKASKEKTHPDYPLVVLINHWSASASEIVAGALADKLYNRATLVGERSHGKGSVQVITSYPGGGAELKYTMAYYHLPSGQRVESQDEMKKQGRKDWGVGPNVELELRSDELTKMWEVQKDNDVLAKADHNSGASPLKKHGIEETLAADPQLAVAVLVVKSKLIEANSLCSVVSNVNHISAK